MIFYIIGYIFAALVMCLISIIFDGKIKENIVEILMLSLTSWVGVIIGISFVGATFLLALLDDLRN